MYPWKDLHVTNEDSINSGDKAMILLQSLICYLREKNILTRADLDELRERVELRVSTVNTDIPCASVLAEAAAKDMRDLNDFCGKKYGGKHRRVN